MIKAATYMCNAQYLKKRTLHILIILHEGDRESFFPPTRVASYHFHSLAHFTFYQMNSCFSSSGWHPHKRKGVRAYRCSSVYIDIYGRWCSHVCKSQLSRPVHKNCPRNSRPCLGGVWFQSCEYSGCYIPAFVNKEEVAKNVFLNPCVFSSFAIVTVNTRLQYTTRMHLPHTKKLAQRKWDLENQFPTT